LHAKIRYVALEVKIVVVSIVVVAVAAVAAVAVASPELLKM
jgi:hypothetical protein